MSTTCLREPIVAAAPRDEDLPDHIDEFVFGLLRAGTTVTDVAVGLVDGIPLEGVPGERPGMVVAEMLTRTIRAALDDAPPQAVRQATRLIAAAAEATSARYA